MAPPSVEAELVRNWQLEKFSVAPLVAMPLFATAPPEAAEFDVKLQRAKSAALLIARTAPPMPVAMLPVNTQFSTSGPPSVMSMPAPSAARPLRIVKPRRMKRLPALPEISTARPEEPPSMKVTSREPMPWMTSARELTEIGAHVPGATLMVVPFGAASIAAWIEG